MQRLKTTAASFLVYEKLDRSMLVRKSLVLKYCKWIRLYVAALPATIIQAIITCNHYENVFTECY